MPSYQLLTKHRSNCSRLWTFHLTAVPLTRLAGSRYRNGGERTLPTSPINGSRGILQDSTHNESQNDSSQSTLISPSVPCLPGCDKKHFLPFSERGRCALSGMRRQKHVCRATAVLEESGPTAIPTQGILLLNQAMFRLVYFQIIKTEHPSS